MSSRFAELSREQLAVLVPELLLCGHLIDRSGMAHSIAAFGRDGMAEVAIEEWQLASPIYTRRMRAALRIPGDGVEAIFKGLQLDIGAPPQFMDFRFRVDDYNNGEFWLDHCGALADVEPMGEDFVVAMCHTIEDPTFDATALATNPLAQVRPIHRPPRRPADRVPVCAWTVKIDPAHEPPPVPANFPLVERSAAAQLELAPIDPSGPGWSDYAGPLLSDVPFAEFSKSALVRMADEVCLQQHLLTLGFLVAVRDRADEDTALGIARKQFTGIAGLTSERLRTALGLGGDFEALAQVLRLHPAWNPLPYSAADITAYHDSVVLRLTRDCPAVADGAWPALLDAEHPQPLEAMVRGVDPHFTTRVHEDGGDLVVEIGSAVTPFKEIPEVAITRFSTGAGFTFGERRALPLTVV
ncbi:hypothetical protein BJY24_002295 [Nocardia transvalensis]|uniref:Uncharacterized protein n=1 Tax=Nocardia transvalensis TaxID=37333 RepID=A0A7W9UHJ6_9NOCA|nr:hypothetical protein [Nocardia transvalensis]MBB5913428.1 hypothetical protein [Nocardia transvalensis]